MALDTDGHAISRRKALKVSVAALLSEAGFGMAEEMAVETLTEALQAYINELGRSAKSYAEHSGRTEPMVSDVVMTLINMGLDIRGIPTHARRPNKSVFVPPAQSPSPSKTNMLQVGERRPHPSHIPDHLPPFPDPHTYIKTDAIRQPFNEYQVIRERAANQKRDVERALTRYMAKAEKAQQLFKDDVHAFPLSAVKPGPHPYLDTLLHRDQEPDSHEQEKLPSSVQPVTSALPSAAMEISAALGLGENGDCQMGPAGIDDVSQYLQPQDSGESDAIDNPYLRSVRMPRRKIQS